MQTGFKTYDLRAKLGPLLNEVVAKRIGLAFVQVTQAKTVVVGRDNRLSSERLAESLICGLLQAGAKVYELGLAGTEEVYFATSHLNCDGGIQITASHNPIDYNGMKFVSKGSLPIGRNNGLNEIEALVYGDKKEEELPGLRLGELEKIDLLSPFTDKVLSFIKTKNLRPLKVIVNAGNGSAGHAIDAIEEKLKAIQTPIEFIKILHEPDGSFPHGIPNPLLPHARQMTSDAIKKHGADIGFAWDGDFDRCFAWDENGNFIEGYYIVGLLAEAFLQKGDDKKIIHDPRLYWNTQDIVSKYQGQAICSATGHAYIKKMMRDEDAVYGGEMSAHHYFRDFYYCDSGMIPFLLLLELLSVKKQNLSSMLNDRIAAYPCSGEINFTVKDTSKVISKIRQKYSPLATHLDELDGLSMEFSEQGQKTWRFNLRASNTEPLLRLNIESKNDTTLMQEKTAELSSLIESFAQ